jgi:hypothetical protein
MEELPVAFAFDSANRSFAAAAVCFLLCAFRIFFAEDSTSYMKSDISSSIVFGLDFAALAPFRPLILDNRGPGQLRPLREGSQDGAT